MNREYTLLCPFGGLGAGALGFQLAERRLFETHGRFRVIGGVDVDPAAAPVILAADGTWHRPLTTLELAVLQGLPAVHNGAPLTLAGTSNSAHRERIGNAVPVQAATAIAEQMLQTLLSADLGAFALSSDGGVWVEPQREAIQ